MPFRQSRHALSELSSTIAIYHGLHFQSVNDMGVPAPSNRIRRNRLFAIYWLRLSSWFHRLGSFWCIGPTVTLSSLLPGVRQAPLVSGASLQPAFPQIRRAQSFIPRQRLPLCRRLASQTPQVSQAWRLRLQTSEGTFTIRFWIRIPV